MHPILVETGPWSWGAYPVIVLILALIVGLVQWLESRRAGSQSLTATNWALTTLFVLAGAAAMILVVNKLAPIYVHSYGVMLLIALAAGTWWLTRTGRNYGFNLEDWIDFALIILLSGVVGARLLYVLLHLPDYASAPITILYVWQGGLAFHGGVAGAIIAGYIFACVRRISFPLLADLSAPALALGYAIARIGCFLNGCCYGHRCDLPWGVTFPPGTEAGAGGFPRHPTQLYACAASFIIFLVLARLQPRIKVRGNLFLLYLVLYSVYRFIVEFFRRGATANVFAPLAPLTEAQTASIVIGIGALITIFVRRHRREPEGK